MKNIFLILALVFSAFAAKSNCPDSVKYSGSGFTFYYGAVPSGTYNQLRVTIGSGTGSGNSYTLGIVGGTGATIVTNDASGAVDGSSVASKISYWNSGSPTAVADCNSNVPLPVKLVSFKASLDETQGIASLQWVTASEINNDRFEIERSATGNLFTKVTEVKGHGNSDQLIVYAAVVRLPEGGAFFRLKQVDYNGCFEYSNVIFVDFDRLSNLSVSPNPFGDVIELSLPEGVSTVEIRNGTGRTVATSVIEGDAKHRMSTEGLPDGIYYVTVGEKVFKMVKRND